MAAINESGDRYLTRAIPRDYVELDCREEGKVNLSVIHVICDAWGLLDGVERSQIISNNPRKVWKNGK